MLGTTLPCSLHWNVVVLLKVDTSVGTGKELSTAEGKNADAQFPISEHMTPNGAHQVLLVIPQATHLSRRSLRGRGLFHSSAFM